MSKNKQMWGYVMKLEDDCWYVGISSNHYHRMMEHLTPDFGSEWTKLHNGIARTVLVKLDGDGKAWEREKTLEMMRIHGSDKVRGGSWSQKVREKPPLALQCPPIRVDKRAISASHITNNRCKIMSKR